MSVPCMVGKGVVCLNSNNPGERCKDYEVCYMPCHYYLARTGGGHLASISGAASANFPWLEYYLRPWCLRPIVFPHKWDLNITQVCPKKEFLHQVELSSSSVDTQIMMTSTILIKVTICLMEL